MTQNFLLTVFPTAKDKNARLTLAADLARALIKICPGQVAHIHSDEAKLALLIQGEIGAITKTVDSICRQNDDSWFLAQVGTPCATSGLSKADGWLRSHSQGCPK